jgi:hypothetical protein
MSNVKAQMSNQILSSKVKKFWILNFEIHLTLRFWNLGLDEPPLYNLSSIYATIIWETAR